MYKYKSEVYHIVASSVMRDYKSLVPDQEHASAVQRWSFTCHAVFSDVYMASIEGLRMPKAVCCDVSMP